MMMKKETRTWELNKQGEIIRPKAQKNVKKKYKSDTFVDHPVMAVLIMVLCAAVDFFVFRSLFSKISYDDPLMMGMQIAGLLFGFDVVPIFMGIQLRRIRQGLSRDKFIMAAAFVACAMAMAMNIGLRMTTIEIMSPDLSSTTSSFVGSTSTVTTNESVDPVALAMAICGICLPLVTSIGSFFISYLTYNPLMVRKQRLEEMLLEKRDDIRRIKAVLGELKADTEFEERLSDYDEEKYEISIQEIKVQAAEYCEYVKLRLAEYLQDPSDTSLLTQDDCTEIFQQLDHAMEVLDSVSLEGSDNSGEVRVMNTMPAPEKVAV